VPRRAPGASSRQLARFAGLAACALLCAGAAPAEKPAPAAEPAAEAEQPKPEPEVIAIPEIAIRSEQITGLLRTVEARLGDDPAVDAIEKELPQLVSGNLALLSETNHLLEQGPRQRVLEAIVDSWQAAHTEMTARNTALTKRAKALESDIARLAGQRDVWQRTGEQAIAGKAPETVRDRVQSTLEAIDSTRRKVEGRREVVLELQARAVRELALIELTLERISTYRKQVVGKLFLRDSRPIWRAMSSGAAAGEAITDLVDDAARAQRLMAEYLKFYQGRWITQIVLFAALALMFRSARERSRRASQEEPELLEAARVLQTPYSAALVLALLSSFWIFPEAPFVMKQLTALLALFPVLRMARPMVDPALAPGLNAFGAFFVVDRLRDVFSTSPLAEQVLFLLEMLAGVALMAWVLRPRRLEGVELSPEQTAALKPLGNIARLLLVCFTFSFGSGALGYLQLARLIGGGALTCTYAALAFYASLRAADGLLAIALRRRPLRLLRFVNTHRDVLRYRLHGILRVSAVIGWLALTLSFFGVLESVLDAGRAVLGASLSFGTLTLSLGHLAAFGITVASAFLISRVLRFLLEEDVYPRVQLGRGVPYAISSLLHYTILFGGFVLAVFAMGVDLTRVTILAGAFGVGIGFGLQNVVNNFVSGLIMLFERPVKLGDTVQVADVTGTVERIGIRSSTVRTFEGAEVIVPNANLISERLTNWTLSNTRRRIDIKLGVAYGTDPEKLLQMLISVARAHRQVLAYPPPLALFQGFGENSLDFELRCWTDAFDAWVLVRSQLALEVHRALVDAGIEVPFPQRVLHVRAEKPKEDRS
jgi:small-conductance mechanosensitive channel